MALDNGVLGMSGRNTDLDLGVFAGEVGESLGQEGPIKIAGQSRNQISNDIMSVPARHTHSMPRELPP